MNFDNLGRFIALSAIKVMAFLEQVAKSFERPPDIAETVRVHAAPIVQTQFPRVQRRVAPYWQERGWTRRGCNYRGYYRSKIGAWRGRAQVSPSGKAHMFIHQPPEFLKSHPHWACFAWRSGGWYSIHMHGGAELSAGILGVEEILNEAFRKEQS